MSVRIRDDSLTNHPASALVWDQIERHLIKKKAIIDIGAVIYGLHN